MTPRCIAAFGVLACCALAGPLVRADVVINEIMYHSVGANEVEYVELVNTGPGAQDLTGWTLIDGFDEHTPCALEGTLAPGEFLVVVNVIDWFTAVYPAVTNVNPNPFGSVNPDVGFGLGNNSEEVRLFDAGGERVDEVEYLDDPPWPPEPDGFGPSLELIHPLADNADVAFWRASLPSAPLGTPGAENTVRIADLPPTLGKLRREPLLPTASDSVVVSARAEDVEALVAVTLHLDTGSGFAPAPMFDDGNHGDGGAGNGRFGATIPALPTGTVVRYYLTATDSLGQTATVPDTAPAEWLAYTVDYVLPTLRVNEFLASNLTGILDGAGDSDDWLELRNPGPGSRSLEGMFLTNDLDETTKWELPDVILRAGERLLIWCDGQPLQGPFHTSFSLPRGGGAVGLYDTVAHGNTLVHGFTYGPQSPDVSFGYRPETSDAPEYLATPTPEANNSGSDYFSPVCINEFFASSQIGLDDWVEVYNRGDATVDLDGWFLSDDPAEPTRYAFPPGTLLVPGGFLIVDQATLGFGLSADGDEALLLSRGDGTTGADWFDFGPQFADISQGRFADGTPNWHFFSAWSAEAPNACQPLGAPGPVAGVGFENRTAMTWQPTAAAAAYDVTVGDLDDLRGSGGDFAASVLGCAENNSADTSSWIPGVPRPGTARFYVVRATNVSCGFGTWDPVPAPPAGSRDPGLATAQRCP